MKTAKISADEKEQESLKKSGVLPRHIAIIMDGNGRWAKKKGLPRFAGHKAGVDSVRDIVEAAAQLGIKFLTLYTFSTENWKRPQAEVTTLMRLLSGTLKKEIGELNRNNIRLKTIGDFSSLPEKVQNEFIDAMKLTEKNDRMNLILALSYGSRHEIIEGVKKITSDILNGNLTPDMIDAKLFGNYLYTAGIPDPDLVIRTSGEFRVSNFLLWQIAYSEFYITDEFWPDFRRKNFYEAIRSFQKRERRFGKVSEQIVKQSN